MSHRAPPFSTFRVLVQPAVAEAAYKVVAPRLLALRSAELVVMRGDVQVAAAFALGLARWLAEPEVRVRFTKLAEIGEVDGASVAELGQVAMAAWYAKHRLLLAGAAWPGPQVPVALVDEALVLRSRLRSTAEERSASSGEVAEEVGSLRGLDGCLDLAGDLVVLASICGRGEASGPATSEAARDDEDDVWQREREVERASHLAEELLARIHGDARDHGGWPAQVQRAWTLLRRSYEEVRRAGLFLFPGRVGRTRFPPLLRVARESVCTSSLADVYLAEHGAEPPSSRRRPRTSL